MRKQLLISGVLLSSTAFLSGCGIGAVNTSSTGSVAISGIVHGGQNPVTDATIQLYTVGSAGNGSSATPMLTTAVTTTAGGGFSISDDYTCGESSPPVTAISGGSNQVYIVATDGNPGLSGNNPAMVLVAALGDCANLPTTKFIEINEVTTAAAVWALAPFMTASTDTVPTYRNIGATSSNPLGIQNAFKNAALLADTETGQPTMLPSNLTIETDKLNAFADAIASCVNSDGTTGCDKLFTAATSAGVPRPTDTLTAALDIVTHPGTNVDGVFGAIGGFPPFPTAYTQAPNDWTMSLTVTGGGLDTPSPLGIDSLGNVWVAGQNGPLSAFSPQGTPLSATGFGGTGENSVLEQTFGLAIDSGNNIWVTNYNARDNVQGSVTKFYGSSSGMPGTPVTTAGYYDPSIYYPDAIAADTNGNVFIANSESSSATVYTQAGKVYTNPDSVYSAGLGTYLTPNEQPNAIAVDATHGFWLSGSDTVVEHISADGTQISAVECCDTPHGVALDASGDAWIANYLGSSFSEVVGDATVPLNQVAVGGLDYPSSVAIDGGQNVWFANSGGGSISEIAGGAGTVAAGTALSPTTGVYGPGGFGLDAALSNPYTIAPDPSGNIWVSNQGYNNLVMFFGLATPTVTPIQPKPAIP